jgi:exo-1,4-beta-D-glucosaminidase
MLPKEHLWPIDEFWNFHAGGDEFKDIKRFTAAVEARYGKAESLLDFTRKSQALTYEAQRAMFEGYARNKYTSTGVIQWMLNNAWPSLIWHLYDYYLRPGGGYFGTKKACEPLHVQFSYDDRSVTVVNDLQQGFQGLKVKAEVFDLQLASKFSGEAQIDVAADGVARSLVVPRPQGVSGAYFLRLELRDAQGARRSSNVYWLSTKEDVLDWKKTQWYFTPTKVHADLTALAKLPRTQLKVAARYDTAGAEGRAQVTVENAGQALAFQVRLKLVDAQSGDELLPVYWDDNYLTLWPGEKRELAVTYPWQPQGRELQVSAEAWNAEKAR